ncbi:MAG: ribosomal protein S18-alanine N-acetyltransferase [Rhodoferax sp.]|uniref:ribosomal protein S18-alanine N-acetyltransferase n=1 Tax=Rhodoferax sp. TaxID=50421 RepID=UPI0014004F74|nr:ribosomal protein S18-alanine N-acetyltransferase [Rhodoferax sp.]NDP38739.1 ribosomal protein S18-alanine N-acetyltransferase [Rhodoferax sp.]
MSAVLKPVEVRFEPLTLAKLDTVLRVEQQAYAHPWARNNFEDSIKAGYQVQLLLADDTLLGYFVAMKGVEEVHLLNITVAPDCQRQGWAQVLLDALSLWAKGQGAAWLWLEVRISNERAIRVYEAHGFRRVGQRKNYYPGAHGQREDALVMSLPL